MKRAALIEEWRPVLGWEGTYEVSDLGRVRSVEREVPAGWSRRVVHPKVLSQYPRKDGYVCVAFTKPGKKYHIEKCVHRLVLEAFVGPRPKGMWGCHEDDIKSNNWLGNLRWDTPKNNYRDAVVNGNRGVQYRRRQSRAQTLLSLEQVAQIREQFTGGFENVDFLSTTYGVCHSTIYQVAHGSYAPLCHA